MPVLVSVLLKCIRSIQLFSASKKEELSLKKFSEEVAERDAIIQGLRTVLEEKKDEIEDLTKRLEDEMDTRRGEFSLQSLHIPAF